jgi:hypothetical protein
MIHQERLDQVVLQGIADALDERILARAVEKALERLRGGQDRLRVDEPPSSVSYLFLKHTLATWWMPSPGVSATNPFSRG